MLNNQGQNLLNSHLFSGDDVKKRWKNLRDTYAKFLRNSKTKTGQAASSKKWLWAKQMEYLRPFLAFAKTSSNVAAPETSQDSETRGSEGANDTLVPDPLSDQKLEEHEPSIAFIEEETTFLDKVEQNQNIEEIKEVADDSEKMMPPPAKKKKRPSLVRNPLRP